MIKIILKIILFLLISSPAWAYNTYYIDYNAADDSADGSISTPWKRHPYMTGFSGSYSHTAEDHFIFKGGVTWPRACFPMSVVGSGTSNSARDYYGRDVTWYTGGSWTRPIFDLAGASITTPAVTITGSNIDFDYIELKNALIVSGSASGGGFYVSSASNVTFKYMYIHDWDVTGSTDTGGGGVKGYSVTNVIVEYTEIDGGSAWGVCTRDIDEVRYSTIHDAPNLTLGVPNVHHNTLYNVLNCTDGNTHENAYEAMTRGDNYYYNNIIHDTYAADIIDVGWGDEVGTHYVFNNVFYNTTVITMDGNNNAASASSTIQFFNNTIDCGGSTYKLRAISGPIGTVNIRNNHWINCTGDNPFYNQTTITNLTHDYDVEQSTAEALAQGYVVGNNYAPTSGIGDTVNVGVDLSTYFTAAGTGDPDDRVLVTRPQGASWDIGAYEFDSAPANTIQGVSISNLNVTDNLTAWNRSDGLR